MAKCIPYVYGKADRALLDKIEADRPCNDGILAEYWQVGSAVCEKSIRGYYYVWILQKDSFYGRIVRKYRVNKYGKLTETDNFFSVPTKADFLNWCADRGIEWKENV